MKNVILLEKDIEHFQALIDSHGAFTNAASPEVIALFLSNKHYKTQYKYLETLREAMRVKYKTIVNAGFILQLDGCQKNAIGFKF